MYGLCLGVGLLAQAPALTTVPLLSCQGYPCVQAEMGGRQVRLLIDTGNVNSSLDRRQSGGMKLRPAHTRDGKLVPGFQFADLPGWSLGGQGMGPVRLLVEDLAGYVAKGEIPASDGSLAYSAFDGRLLVLDYVHHRLEFSARLSQPLACGGCPRLERITFGKQGPPILVGDGFEVNGHRLRAQIDTLYGGTLLIYPAAVARLGLAREDGAARQQEFFPFTDGGVKMRRTVAASESLGGVQLQRAPLYFATPGVHLPDALFEGTIGRGFLGGQVLELDLRDGWFSLHG